MKEHKNSNAIAPSLLAADFSNLKQQVELVEEAGAQWLHFDIMDGHFVPNISFGPMVLKALRKNSWMFFDTHLMISDPDAYLEEFVKVGAQNITVHYETTTHLHRTLSKIRSLGCSAGLSFNPATPINYDLIDHIHDHLDLILIMSVNPGFGGQQFIPSSIEKVKKLRSYLDEKGYDHIKIQVDGGIDYKTGKVMIEAGANVLVAGSSIFGKDNITEATKLLLRCLDPDSESEE